MLLAQLKARFVRGSAARDVATLTTGTAIAQAVALAATPFLTRLYTPADFGVLAIFLTVVGIASTLVTGRYETSIIIPKNNIEANNIAILSLLLTIFGSSILVFTSYFLPDILWNSLGLASIQQWLPLAFAVAGATAIISIAQTWLNRRKAYSQIAAIRILQSTMTVGLALSFAYFHTAWGGLLVAQTVACFSTAVLAVRFAQFPRNLRPLGKIFHVARVHQDAPKYLLATALLDAVTLQMPIVLIAAWFSEAMAGQFSMAWRLLMLPIILIGGAIGQVFIQRFSTIKNHPTESRKLLAKTWLILFITGIIPFLFILVAGESLFLFALGKNWHDSGRMAILLAPLALAMLISSPTSGTYTVLGLQRYNLLFAIVTFLYRPACIYAGKYFNNIYLGIFFWIVFDLIVLTVYQMVAWHSIGNKNHE